MAHFDPFYLFRYLLCVTCGIYAAVRTAQSLWRLHGWLWADRRSARLIRNYLWVQLLRIRLRRFLPDLIQIALLLALLTQLIYWHRCF